MMCLYLDSSAARGVLSGKGAGRLRHLSCRVLWLQDLFLGIWRGNSLEGVNDQETSSNMSQIRDSKVTVNHKSIF